MTTFINALLRSISALISTLVCLQYIQIQFVAMTGKVDYSEDLISEMYVQHSDLVSCFLIFQTFLWSFELFYVLYVSQTVTMMTGIYLPYQTPSTQSQLQLL